MNHTIAARYFLSFLVALFGFAQVPAQAMTDAELTELFNKAFEESRSGDLAEAISIYESILGERPDLNRVRIELAVANYRALNYAAARQLGEQVLADPSAPESVKANVRRFLAAVEEQSQPHLWTPFISVGYIHDDNVNVAPASSLIDLGAGTLTLNTSPVSANGVQVNAGLSHRYLFPRSYNLMGAPAALAWQSEASLFRNQYIGEGDFSLNVITLRTGPTLLAARKWQLRLAGEVNHVEIGNDAIAVYAGISPSITRYFAGRTALTASFLAQDRNFLQSINDDRDAAYLSGSLTLGHTFPLEWRPTLQFGADIYTENADTSRRSNDGYALRAGFNVQPITRSNVYFNYYWRSREYDGPEPVFGIARDEIERRYIAGASYRLDTGMTLTDFLLNLSYTRSENGSNVPIFDYQREQVVFSVSKAF